MGQKQVKAWETTMGGENGLLDVEKTLEEFSLSVERCDGGVCKTSVSSIDKKAMAEVLSGKNSVFSGGRFQVAVYGSVPLHGLDDHYFGLTSESFCDMACVHGDIETSAVFDVEDGVCKSAVLTTKDDGGGILLTRDLDSNLGSDSMVEFIQKSRIIMEFKSVFRDSQIVGETLKFPLNCQTMTLSFSDYLWNDNGETDEYKDSILVTCTDSAGSDHPNTELIVSMFPEYRSICQHDWRKFRMRVPTLSFP